MHEYSIMLAVVERLLQESECHGAAAVTAAHLEVGLLASLSHVALRQAFEVLTRGTALQDAQLEITEVPGRVRCDKCGLLGDTQELGLEVGHDAPLLLCPACGYLLTATQGREVVLKEVVLSFPEAGRASVGRVLSSAHGRR